MPQSFEELLRRLDQLSGQFEDLREGIRRAVDIAERDPEMSLTRARKVLEYVVRQVYESRCHEPAGTRPLENLLQTLTRDGHLPRRLAAYANAVRELGNVGTHAFGERVTPQDVWQSLNQLLQIVEWYFEQSGAGAADAGEAPAQGTPVGRVLPLTRPVPGRPYRNSLGNTLQPVPPDAGLSAGGAPGLRVCITCVSNADYLEFVRDGGPEPRGSPTYPLLRSWQGKHCPDALRDHPVLFVAHADACLFCDWLTERERRAGKIDPDQAYCLPRAEEWKAWARSQPLPRDAVLDRAWRPGEPQPTAPVSWGEPSSSGLYHLYGNVFEWCHDEPSDDGGASRVALGGGWASNRGWMLREIERGKFGEIRRRLGLPMKDGGFRVCLAEARGPGGA
jgi:hypothetical protein